MAPIERRYSPDHQWAQQFAGSVRVGLTDHAQRELGEITFVELPSVGTSVTRGSAVCAIDALKAATEVYAPVGGTVTAVNVELREPSQGRLINEDAEGAGWIFELGGTSDDELSELMDREAYRKLTGDRGD